MRALLDAHPRVLLAWSSGKDAAWALHRLRQAGRVDVVALLTTFTDEMDRVAMHGVRRELVEDQAEATGLPLLGISLPWPCSNGAYDAAMTEALAAARTRFGISQVAFGDLFLKDIRRYRESRMAGTGLTPVFPLWGLPTDELAREMLRGGLNARITCVDSQQCDPEFAGRCFDEDFLAALPATVDPCGERGEFHSFATAGPMFSREIPVRVGDMSLAGSFVYCDLQRADGGTGLSG